MHKKIATFPLLSLLLINYRPIWGTAAEWNNPKEISFPPCFPRLPHDKLAMLLTSRPGSPEGPVRPGGPTGPGGPRSPGPPGAPCLPGSPWKERETNTVKSKGKQILHFGVEVVCFDSLKPSKKVLETLSKIIWFVKIVLINTSHK